MQAKTLFATHYHELTGLADSLPRVANVHIAADERDGDVTFLRTVRDGPTDRSYGIHVADLAGVPDPVVERSRDVLERLREEKAIEAKGGGSSDPVQAVFDLGSGQFSGAASPDGGQSAGESETDEGETIDPEAKAVLEDLETLDVNTTPPIELVSKVQTLQQRLTDRDD